MSNIIQNLDDITDSREMIEAKPHKFTIMFTYILLLLFSVAVAWSYFGKIDVVITARGIVKPVDKIKPVINEVDGKIKSINFKEGEIIKEGDILYELDTSEFIRKKEKYEKQLEILKMNNDANKLQYEALIDEIEALEDNIENSIVRSISEGIVNTKIDLFVGKTLKSGEGVLQIIPENNLGYLVELHVANKDISNIQKGQNIKYHIDAFPYEEYGEMNGEIIEISNDSIVDEYTGNSYYLVKAIIKNKPLISREGKSGELKSGMTCEAYIINKQERILYYILEKVNLRN